MKRKIRLKCLRCGNEWNQRGQEVPRRCPNCGSLRWNKSNVSRKDSRVSLEVNRVTDSKTVLKIISECQTCKTNPVVFITSGKIPVCDLHWVELAESVVEWESVEND